MIEIRATVKMSQGHDAWYKVLETDSVWPNGCLVTIPISGMPVVFRVYNGNKLNCLDVKTVQVLTLQFATRDSDNLRNGLSTNELRDLLDTSGSGWKMIRRGGQEIKG